MCAAIPLFRVRLFCLTFNEEAVKLCYLYEPSWPILLSELLNVHLFRVSYYYRSQRVLFMVFRVPCTVHGILEQSENIIL
jgi:hypothetical protein